MTASALTWETPIPLSLVRQLGAPVGHVTAPPEKFGRLLWDLAGLSRQDPWAQAAADARGATVLFFGRLAGAPFALYGVETAPFVLFVASPVPGDVVLDALFAALRARPWGAHDEPTQVM